MGCARTPAAQWPPKGRSPDLHAPHGERQPPKRGRQPQPGREGRNPHRPAQSCRMSLVREGTGGS
eukprot:9770353-Alexandrium_andersonii.AAC.1